MSNVVRRVITRGPIAWMAKNTVASNILMWVCLIGGLLSYSLMRKEVFPEYDLDRITVSVGYPGASPEEVEQGILVPIEQALSQVTGLNEVTATANEGSGQVVAEVDESENTEVVYQKIQQTVSRITTLPLDVERPTVAISAPNRRVVTLVVYGKASELTLRNAADEVRDALLADEGITQVDLQDVRGHEVHIEINEQKRLAHGLTLQQVADVVRRNALDVSGGSVSAANGEILLRMVERKDEAKALMETVVLTSSQGGLVRLRDIATVRDGFQDIDRNSTYNGLPAVELTISRAGDQTPIGISDATMAVMQQVQTTLPEGIEVAVLNDRSESYRQRLELLSSNAVMGLALVMILLTLFLDWKLAFWVSMGIPTAFLGAMIVLPWLGVTFNMISMFAFIIALGIVVDDAIVAGENIYEYRQQGYGLLEASIKGARDVAVPIVFSILTNIASFAPLLFIPGTLGKVWVSIPLVVCTVFVISLIEALFILPAHLSISKDASKANRLYAFQQKFANTFDAWVENRYGPFLQRCVRNRYIALAVGVAILLVGLAWPISGRMGFELFPTVESDVSEVRAQLPLGSTTEQANAVRDILVARAQRVVDANGGKQLSEAILASVNENNITVRVYLTPPDIRPVQTAEFTKLWREATGTLVELESIRFASDSGGPGSGPAFSVQLSHRDEDTLQKAADRLAAELSDFPNVSEVDDGFQNGKQQINMRLKPEAFRLGLDANNVGRQVRAAFFGAEGFRVQRGRSEVKVLVRSPEAERISSFQVSRLMILTPAGKPVPLEELAELELGRAFATINRKEGRRIVTVTANVNPRSQAPQIRAVSESELLPRLMTDFPGLSYAFSGRQADTDDALSGLGKGFSVALLAIFVLLAVPFKSYIQPMIVMLAIPFGIFGAIVGHLLMGYSLSLISMMGILALSGVVVNGSLVMMDFANEQRRNGVDALQAICASGVRRFRPIFLTTASTFLGLMPMIFETSRQARFMIPMAISLGFGVVFATAITLILVPCLYMMVEDVLDVYYAVDQRLFDKTHL